MQKYDLTQGDPEKVGLQFEAYIQDGIQLLEHPGLQKRESDEERD